MCVCVGGGGGGANGRLGYVYVTGCMLHHFFNLNFSAYS